MQQFYPGRRLVAPGFGILPPVVPVDQFWARNPWHRLGGLSANITPTAAVEAGAGLATPIASATLATSVASTLGITAAAAVPVIGAAIAAVTFAIVAIMNSGCGQTCIVTSQWANQVEPQLQANIAAYFALPAPRPQSSQAAALANFDTLWSQLSQACSNPQLGAAGTNCLGDREQGACKWKQTSTLNSSYPGAPAIGACWNWFSGYRDPIAQDAAVPDDQSASYLQAQALAAQAAGTSASTTSTSTTGTSTSTSTTTPVAASTSSSDLILLAAAGLVILGLVG